MQVRHDFKLCLEKLIKGFFLMGFSSLLVPINAWANRIYLETDRNIDSITVLSGILHIQI